jgi:cation:H+ antiporter
MIDAITLLAGLAVLVKSADLLVKGAVAVAARWDVPPLVVGLTIVSFGTSMPELVVTMVSGLRNNSDLAIASILGSNVANVLLILGVAAIIRPLPVRDSTVESEIPFSLAAALLVGFLANAHLFASYPELSLSRLDGAILLFFFFLFMLYTYKISREGKSADSASGSVMPGRTAATLIGAGVIGLYFGGQWTVDGAVDIASRLGIDDAVVGLTVIAIGTSAPELVASAVAAYRNEPDIAVGNVVGSNIFNLLWILGLTSSVVELPFQVVSNADIVIVIASSSLLILALVVSRKNTVMRHHGVFFLLLYAAYLLFAAIR